VIWTNPQDVETGMTATVSPRAAWMGLLARARPEGLAAALPELPPHDVLRGPEIGSVMVRGRIGATGAPFNLGEMTVTRCTVRLATGEVGHAHVQGRDKAHATRAAVVDALMQTAEAGQIERSVLQPLGLDEQARRRARAAKAAATKVEFFTLVRGEDT
jgi:alpha-D-ribose 1-methylphosphonate 5-triphosphate synthase subunit PhnG